MNVIAGLKPITVDLRGGGADPVGPSEDVPLRLDVVYELRCDNPVHVLAGGGDNVTARNLQVRPDTPILFRADVEQMRIAAASASATAWLREVTR